MFRLFTSLYLLLLGIALLSAVVIFSLYSTDKFVGWRTIDMGADYVGLAHIIEQSYQNLEEARFQQMVDDYPDFANVPLEILDVQALEISEQNIAALTPGSLIIDDLEDSILYYRFIDSDQVARFGPIGTYEPLDTAAEYYLLWVFVFVALGIFIWVWRLQKKLSRLDLAATKFGEGDFNTRVSVKGRHKIGGLNHSFNQMAERIESLIKGHKSLTNAVAHELRTPVSRIRFQLDMMHDEKNEAKRNEFMYGISDDVEELGELVDELLTFARFDREARSQNMQSHSLHVSLQSVLNARNMENPIEVKYDQSWLEPDADVQTMQFEPKYLERAIGNLVANAQKYAESTAVVSVQRTVSVCTIKVDDDGPGIPESDRESIFEPFKRLDDSRTRSTGGYGLGLAIVKQIVEWHGGKIIITQSPQGGARFSFNWPLNDEIEF